MIRGTTPTHIFRLPIQSSIIKSVRVTYKQDEEVVLKKELTDCVLLNNELSIRLTQEDTLRFKCDGFVLIQLRVVLVDGTALSTEPIRVHVAECLDGEALA